MAVVSSALRLTDSCYFPLEISVLGDPCHLPPVSVGAWESQTQWQLCCYRRDCKYPENYVVSGRQFKKLFAG